MSTQTSFSVLQTIKLLREKAAEINGTADRLEAVMQDFGIGRDGVLTAPGPSASKANYEDILTVLRQKGAGRAKEIGKKLGITKEAVLKIVEANSEAFEIRPRGWITLSHHMNGARGGPS